MAALTIISAVQALKNYSSDTDTDSSSDEEWQKIRKIKCIRNVHIQNYVQFVVARYEDYEFKSHFRSVCDRFNVGRATALRAVRRVTHALFLVALQYISWPSEDQAEVVIRKFQEISGFPQTIEVIDGTHIRIEAPTENAADYINRKGYHSIQLQVKYN
ncbi:Putative nuclease HARBI1 [Trachymyrmex zeteki]|nr:Putative nuclease HARBI1 [Trachymyrmex zeteki]